MQAETLALALLSCAVQEKDLMGNMDVVTSIFEVQGYCQVTLIHHNLSLSFVHLSEMGLHNSLMLKLDVLYLFMLQISDEDLLECRGLVINYLNMYRNQRSKLPRLRLVWTVSRRTLNKMKPSTRILLDLEPIFEDEDDKTEESSDDAGPFDR